MLTATLTTGLTANAQPVPLIKTETSATQNLKVFEALWEKVNTKYFDPDFNGVNWSEIRQIYRPKAEKAISKDDLLIVLKQMLAELKTSHLRVWQTVSERKIESLIKSDINRKQDSLQLGYGFIYRIVEGKSVVAEIDPNGSAKSSGLKAGWTLMAVDNNRMAEKPQYLFELKEGKKSTFLFADLENQEHQLTLTANWTVKRPVRVSRQLNDKIGYIKFDGFISGTGNWLRDEMRKFNSPSGIIVDLRGNRGGYIDEVKNCLANFFADDIEFGTFIERTGKIKNMKINGKKDGSFTGAIVVLVDELSTSGAEVFAKLIQENGRGKIVGTHTNGEVLIAAEFGLPSDLRTSIAFRDYLSPKGFRLEGKGVKPDFEVPITIEDIVKSRDAAIEKALETVK